MKRARSLALSAAVLAAIVLAVFLASSVRLGSRGSRGTSAVERARPIQREGELVLRGLERPGEEEGLTRRDPAGEPPSEPSPDASGDSLDMLRVRIRQLLTDYRAEPEASKRADMLRELTQANRRYAKRTDDLQFVGALRDIMNDSEDRTERKLAAIGLQRIDCADPEGLVVGILESGTESPHDEARFYCAEGLGWINGPHAPRARAKLLTLLQHDDPAVREVSALMTGLVVRNAAATDALLDRLGVEPAEIVVYALVRAVLALDPDGGRSRVSSVRSDTAVVAALARAEADIARTTKSNSADR